MHVLFNTLGVTDLLKINLASFLENTGMSYEGFTLKLPN